MRRAAIRPFTRKDWLVSGFESFLNPTGGATDNVNLLFGPASGQVSANALYLDNLRFGTQAQAQAPEPSTVGMIALAGVVGLFLLKKKGQQAVA